MNTQWTDVYDDVKEFEYGGKKFKALIDVSITDDDHPVDVDFEPAELKAYLARFESGELLNVVVRVVASWNGIKGEDYLGACHLKAGSEDDVRQTVEDHGMVAQALDNLSREVFDRLEQLKPLTK